jgi:hypothetical protein
MRLQCLDKRLNYREVSHQRSTEPASSLPASGQILEMRKANRRLHATILARTLFHQAFGHSQSGVA